MCSKLLKRKKLNFNQRNSDVIDSPRICGGDIILYKGKLKELELHKARKKARLLKCCSVVQRDWLNIQIQTCAVLACLHGNVTDHQSGHVVWRHIFILDPICRGANIFHSHLPALRNVAHNQNLSFLLTSLCQNKL